MSISKTTTDLLTLKINYLSQVAYDNLLFNGQTSEDEVYITDYAIPSQGWTIDQYVNTPEDISGKFYGMASYIRVFALTFTGVTDIYFPNCRRIDYGAFYYCSSLLTANFPQCAGIGPTAFAYCSKLKTISFPECDVVNYYAFRGCNKLEEINLPKCSRIYSSAFYQCTSLKIANVPNCSYIASAAFASCYNLISLYLTSVSSVANLQYTDAFASTPISNYTTSTGGVYGSIYVPTSLYNSYITATNWSVYSARIVGMSWNTLINETVTITDLGLRGAVLKYGTVSSTSLENIKTAKISINDIEYICTQDITDSGLCCRYGAKKIGEDEEYFPILDYSIYPFEIYGYDTHNSEESSRYMIYIIVDPNKFLENDSITVKFEAQVNSLP